MGAFENALSELPKHEVIDLYGQALDENRRLKEQLAHTNSTAYDDSEKLFVVALDFDGTLVDRGQWPGMGPDLGAAFWLRKLADRGTRFLLWTMRDGKELQAAVKYCTAHLGIDLMGVNDNPTQRGWSRSPKAHATIYVDDRAIGVPLRPGATEHHVVDWARVGPMLLDAQEDWINERR